jgi:hypothetical protein
MVMNPVIHQLENNGPFLPHLTEILHLDLVKSVERTFANMAERQRKAAEAFALSQNEPLRKKPRWWTDQKYAKMLFTPAELATEGQECNHCVGGGDYAEGVKRGANLIIAINLPGQCRTTVDLRPARSSEILGGDYFSDWYIFQHQGYQNSAPPRACEEYWASIHDKLHANESRAHQADFEKKLKDDGLAGYSSRSTKRLTRKQLSELPIVKMRVIRSL